MKNKIIKSLALFGSLCLVLSVSQVFFAGSASGATPNIWGISPNGIEVGTAPELTITLNSFNSNIISVTFIRGAYSKQGTITSQSGQSGVWRYVYVIPPSNLNASGNPSIYKVKVESASEIATIDNGLWVYPQPTASEIIPPSGGMNDNIALTGTNFLTGLSGNFKDTSSSNSYYASTTFQGPTSARITVPAGQIGHTYNVIVRNSFPYSVSVWPGQTFTLKAKIGGNIIFPSGTPIGFAPQVYLTSTTGTNLQMGSTLGRYEFSNNLFDPDNTTLYQIQAQSPYSYNNKVYYVSNPSAKYWAFKILYGAQADTIMNMNFTYSEQASPPSISLMSPTSGLPGTIVTLEGTNFGATAGTIHFGTTTPSSISWSATKIVFSVPAGTADGSYTVYITTAPAAGGLESLKDKNFTVFSNPTQNIGTIIVKTMKDNGTPITAGFSLTGPITVNQATDGSGYYTMSNAPVGNYSITFQPVGNYNTPAAISNKALAAGATIYLVGTYEAGITPPPVAGLSIDEVDPPSGPAGISITLKGSNFGTGGQVFFNNGLIDPTKVTIWQDNYITFPTPSNTGKGIYDIFVHVGSSFSNTVTFEVTDSEIPQRPSIDKIIPATGKPADSVTLVGRYFGAGGTLYINSSNYSSQVTQWTDSYIILTVPSLAVGTKEVFVKTTGNPNPSNFVPFNITGAGPSTTPKIRSILPTSGPVNTCVTIEGTDFGDLTLFSQLHFGGSAIKYVSWSPSQIVLIVPTGTASGTKEVFVTVGTADSNRAYFTVTGKPVSLTAPTVFNYPNPFDPLVTPGTTNFQFDLTGSTKVGLYIYDLGGRMVYKDEETLTVGKMTWDGKDAKGKIVGNGVYIANIVNASKGKLIGSCKVFVAKK